MPQEVLLAIQQVTLTYCVLMGTVMLQLLSSGGGTNRRGLDCLTLYPDGGVLPVMLAKLQIT